MDTAPEEHLRLQRENNLLARHEVELFSSWVTQLAEPVPLQPEDVLRMRTFAITLKKDIAVLESKRSQDQNQDILKQLIVARARRQLYLWLSFAINDLPAEILAHIFSFVVAPPIDKKLTTNQVLLLSVCAHWRNSALSSPRLWSSLFIHDRPPFHFTAFSLDRAGSVPLELGVDMRDTHWDGNEQKHIIEPSHMTILMNLLIPRIPQIRKLSLLVDTWTAMIVALNRFQSGPVPLIMERLELHRTGNPYVALSGVPRQLLIPAVLFGGKAPSLKYIRLDGVHLNWELSPLRNLRVLEMRRMAMEVMPTLKDFRAMLVNSPEIHTLIFQASGPRWANQELPSWPKLVLQNLHTLHLGDFVAGYAEFIVSLIEAPKLRRLSLDTMDGEDYTPLLRLMTNAFPMLTVLTIKYLEINDTIETEDVLWEWLKSMPKLRFLKVSRITDRFFNAFLHSQQSSEMVIDENTENNTVAGVVCPLLKDVEFVDLNFENISRLIYGRNNLGFPLRYIFVPVDTMVQSDVERYQSLPGVILFRADPRIRRDLEIQYFVD